MKAFLRWVRQRRSLCGFLAIQIVFCSGCTSALWEGGTFARRYGPASPANLRLSYSNERRDILVQYDESKEESANITHRCYWLEANKSQIESARKPHFVSPKAAAGLISIRAGVTPALQTQPRSKELYVVSRREGDFFSLYSGDALLGEFKLPVYAGGSQKVKQVLLTPPAAIADATLVGALIGIYTSPQWIGGLNGLQK
jgi:hypothetical protein